MRFRLEAYHGSPEHDKPGLSYAGKIKASIEFTADYLPNVLAQMRHFLLAAGYDYIEELNALKKGGDVSSSEE
jgi:hypothetical protein